MTLKVKTIILLFFGIHIAHFKAEILTVPDPCPDIQPKTKVADMCRQNEAQEEEENGNDNFDSVALRIKTQKDNCTCLVTIDNPSDRYLMYIRKYNNLNSAAPLVGNCGLEIDMDYPNPEKPIQPISCSNTPLPLILSLVQNGVLTLTSKIISGNFTHGYCLQIIRGHTILGDPTLRVVCAAQGFIPSLTYQQSTTGSSQISTTTNTTVSSSAVYIGLGSGVAGALLLIVVVIIICRKRKSPQRILIKRENESVTAQQCRTEDPAYDLQDNILYITSEQSEGDYTTIAVEKPGSVTKKDDKMQGPVENTQISETYSCNQRDSNQNNGNVYAVVDKSKR